MLREVVVFCFIFIGISVISNSYFIVLLEWRCYAQVIIALTADFRTSHTTLSFRRDLLKIQILIHYDPIIYFLFSSHVTLLSHRK